MKRPIINTFYFQTTPVRILYEVVKSLLVISDLFTDKSQFVWMLDVCLNLSKTHNSEDEILQQYLVIGMCKAVSVLTPVSFLKSVCIDDKLLKL